jgi:hypothetical protein
VGGSSTEIALGGSIVATFRTDSRTARGSSITLFAGTSEVFNDSRTARDSSPSGLEGMGAASETLCRGSASVLLMSFCDLVVAIRLPHLPQKLNSSGLRVPQFQQYIWFSLLHLGSLDSIQQLGFA